MATAKSNIVLGGKKIDPYHVSIQQKSDWHHSFEIAVSSEKIEGKNSLSIDQSITYVGQAAEISIQCAANKKTVSKSWPLTLICNLKEADIGWLSFAEQEFWIFTEKARELLEPLLEEKVEFLPLIHRKKAHLKIPRTQQIIARKAYKPLLDIIHPQPHYLLNILDLKPLNVIDFDQSDFEYDEEKQEIFMTESLAFYREKIKNAHLFKIMKHGKALQRATFISDEFKTIVEENKLTGLSFSEEHEDEGGNLVWTEK